MTDTYDLLNLWEDKSRQSGRTTDLVKALPKDGNCYIVVHNIGMKTYIQNMIEDIYHGEYPIKNTKIVTLNQLNKYLRGVKNIPIFIDHVVFFMENRKLLKRLEDGWF